MTDRLPCQVPFCRRTGDAQYAEWLCGEHYRLADKRLRRLRAKLLRRRQRASVPVEILDRIDSRLWRKAVAQAIERAVGISA